MKTETVISFERIEAHYQAEHGGKLPDCDALLVFWGADFASVAAHLEFAIAQNEFKMVEGMLELVKTKRKLYPTLHTF